MKKLLISLLMLLLISASSFSVNAYANDGEGSSGMLDEIAPEFKSITIETDKTDLNFTKSDNVTIKAVITDNMSGVSKSSYNYVTFRTSSGDSLTASLSLLSEADHTYKGTIYIGQYCPMGKYTISSVSAKDNADNTTHTIPSGSTGLYFNVVNTDVDNTAPVVHSIELDKTTTTASGEITLTANITDTISGFSYGYVYFTNSIYNRTLQFYVSSYDRKDNSNEYTSKLTLNKYTRLGDYTLSSLSVYDAARNSCYDIPVDDAALTFKVERGEDYFYDNTPPEVTSVELKNSKITAPGTITVLAEASDQATDEDTEEPSGEGSGITTFKIYFYNTLYKKTLTAVMNKDTESGKYVGDIEVNQWARPNDYVINSIEIFDLADNRKYMYAYNNTIPESMTGLLFEVFNGGGDVNYEHRSNTENLKEDMKKVKEGDKVLVNYNPENDTLKKEIFEEIKGKDISMTFENEGVQWIINGKDVTDENIKDIHMEVKFNTIEDFADEDTKRAITNITGETPVAVISFPENGELPCPVRMRIKADHTMRKFLGKEEGLYVYYYDNTLKKMKTIAAQVTIEDDQYFEFTIYHCSDYVLSPVELSTESHPDNLAVPANLVWSGSDDKTVASWDSVENAGSYALEVRVDYGSEHKTDTKTLTECSVDLKDTIDKLFNKIEDKSEISKVSFRVQAKSGNAELYNDSAWSEYTADSGYRPVIEEKTIEIPTELFWNGSNLTVANWKAVDNASGYCVQVQVDYGSSKKKTALIHTSSNSVEMKETIDRLLGSIGSETVSSVKFRVYAKSPDPDRFEDSIWSDFSADSGYRIKSEGGSEEDEEIVIAAKGSVTLKNPGFELSKWKSGNSGVASVNSKGVVTGKKAGAAIITAIGKGTSPQTKQYTVIVEKPVWKNASVIKNDSFNVLESISDVSKLKAMDFTSSNSDVLEIDDAGDVTVKKSGKAKLTVLYKYGSVSATYTVKLPNIKQDTLAMLEGKTSKLTLVNNNKNLKISFKSLDTNKVTVNETKGTVTSIAPGTAKIHLLVDGKIYDTCEVTVKKPEITQEKVTVGRKKTLQLKIVNKSKNVTFKSSNDKVATVTKSGKIKGISTGTATISIVINGVEYDKCTVTVE